MRKIIPILLLLILSFQACVGVHEPEEEPVIPVIDPVDGSADAGTRFFHRSFVFDFTGTWCQHCPSMVAALEKVKEQRPGRIVEVSVHQYDEMSAEPLCDSIVDIFPYHGFPAVVFNYDAATYTQEHESEVLLSTVDAALPATSCGLGIDMQEEGTVRIKVKAGEDGDYRLVVFLVEDGLVARQVGYGDNYVNNSVLRACLTASFSGEALGRLTAGQEACRSYGYAFGERLRIVACVLKARNDGLFTAVGAAQCSPGNQLDYRYEQD